MLFLKQVLIFFIGVFCSLLLAGSYEVYLPNEEDIIPKLEKEALPALEIEDSGKEVGAVFDGAFINRLEAVIFSEKVGETYDVSTRIRPVTKERKTLHLPDVFPGFFDRIEEHPSSLAFSARKAEPITQKVENYRDGKISLPELHQWVKQLPEEDGSRGYGKMRVAYLYTLVDRPMSAEIFKNLANGEIEISAYERVDAMRHYARYLHYHQDTPRLRGCPDYQREYALRNYDAYLAYQTIKEYMAESPDGEKLEEAFLGEINKQLVAILLERARCEKVPFSEVRSEAENLLEEFPDTAEIERQYIRLMAAESYFFEGRYDRALDAFTQFLEEEEKLEKDPLPYYTVINHEIQTYMKLRGFPHISPDHIRERYVEASEKMIEAPVNLGFKHSNVRATGYYFLSTYYVFNGEYDKAWEIMEEAVEMFDLEPLPEFSGTRDRSETYRFLVHIYTQKGKQNLVHMSTESLEKYLGKDFSKEVSR